MENLNKEEKNLFNYLVLGILTIFLGFNSFYVLSELKSINHNIKYLEYELKRLNNRIDGEEDINYLELINEIVNE